MKLCTTRAASPSSGSLAQTIVIAAKTALRSRQTSTCVCVALLSVELLAHASSVESAPSSTASTGTLAGLAVEDITPTWPAYEVSTDALATEHYRKIEVKALAISDHNVPVVIVTADIAAFCPEISQQVYARVKSLGFAPRQIVLNSSHIHSVPAICNVDVLDVNVHPIFRYQAFLVDKIVAVIERAKANLKPAALSTSEATCDICINRDGPPHTPGALLPNPGGLIDRRVRVLQVREPKTGQLQAAMALFGCHPSDVQIHSSVYPPATGEHTSFGGDYFGFGRDEVERHYPGVVVLTAQGTGGDVRLAHFKNDDIDQGFGGTYVEDLTPNKEFGRRFGAAIVQALQNPTTPVRGRIRAGMSSVSLPLEKADSPEFAQEQVNSDDPWKIRYGKWLLAKYEQGPIPDSVGPYEMRFIQFGDDLSLAALDGEIFTCIGQQIEQRLAPRRTFVLGYTNYVSAYVPCAENFAPPQNGGNYEIHIYYWWLWQTAHFKPTVDKVIVDAAVALAHTLLQQ